MNTKILLSLSVIAAVAAIAIGGTVAYFSDTETSTGNTFTAGTLDLKVDSTCHYNGNVCGATSHVWEGSNPYPVPGTPCACTWVSKDLETGDVFFNFNDVKPGDSGESTISFDLASNPAWACAYVSKIVDSDNGCNEPEKAAEPGCTPDGNGELDENLKVTAWVDTNCNNVLDSGEEVIVDNQPVSTYIDDQTSVVIPVADNSNGSLMGKGVSLNPGHYCIGIKWSVPTTTGNEVQTDKVGADLTFYVEQARNNPNFVCGQAY
jgi:predicted ribosomally synthesized peptide with SipW-like signal peptide